MSLPKCKEKTEADAEEIFKILSAVVSINQTPVKNSKFDVVNEATQSILLNLSRSNLEWAQQLSTLDISTFCPSTSQASIPMLTDDPRIFLGHILSEIFMHLAEILRDCRIAAADEPFLISVQNNATLYAALQFFILTQLLPYLDEGVGVPLEKRSTYLKSWLRIVDNVELRKMQLQQFLSVMRQLLECEQSVKDEILKRYLPDLLCAHEQIIFFTGESEKWFETLMGDVPLAHQIIVLLSLSKTYDKTKPLPPWFAAAVGNHLSVILRSNDGLLQTLRAYVTLGGASFWENSHLLTCISQQLARPPRGFKKMAYFENVHKQFLTLMKKKIYPEDGMLQLYSSFIDDMAKKDPLAGEVLVLDMLLKPFEILFETHAERSNWDNTTFDALNLLNILTSDKFCSRLLFNNPRLVQLIPLFSGFLASRCFDQDNCPAQIKSIIQNISNILKSLSSKIENLSQLLFLYIVKPNDCFYEIQYNKKMVTVIGEDSDDSVYLCRVNNDDKDEIVMRKLDAVLKFIKVLEKSAGTCLLIEIICESAERWTKCVDTVDDLRFISSDEGDSHWIREASHLIGLFCFEQLGEWDVDPSKPKVLEAMSKLITSILHKTINWIKSENEAKSFFDINSPASDDQKRFIDVQKSSLKMAVGLAAAVVGSGTLESLHCIEEISKALTYFINQVPSNVDEDLALIVKDAEEMLRLLNHLGITNANTDKTKIVAKTKQIDVDYISQLKQDLDDEITPVRGEALIRVSKAIKKRDPKTVAVLEPWLLNKVKELLKDPDSYVYLSAINALAEIACYDVNKYLGELLQMFLQLEKDNEKDDDSTLMLRGKLAEAIGKVFRVLGDISPVWIERAANIFFTALKEQNDIIQASSLSAFSDIVLSCRGKGIAEVLDELLYAADIQIGSSKSALVRRAAVHLVRQCLSSCREQLLTLFGERLRDLYRTLKRVWKWDVDHVVRLHAELCLEEIQAGLQFSQEVENNSMLKIINMK